ncbi:flagellar motor stator protein MotA [Magnetospirillum sulfuroxidans]|uniref:Flagellar motor stator protein MotA n=1 Tax=Magnetospirillum sulfuroxidans TaxID=611300 RepID=A0ABS5I7V9_9PROT|nr:flagellar motor stator protein MotA [Magnetospirillum sulfuroxidans]MBR9970525.1 flagellar motor stator protein MotA [Magnetospirillum sulfuroxidans]
MFAIIGIVVTIASVIGGYAASGGHLAVLWQPFEFIIILGAAFGSMLLGNPKDIVMGVFKKFGMVFKGAHYKKDAYIEMLSMLYAVFKLAKTKGDLALESHVEKPDESPLFQKFPGFSGDHHVRTFLCDYLRLLTLGTSNAHELESIIDGELEAHHKHYHEIAHAINLMADAMPALGIVAAVLGVIHTMGSITEPPEVLGHLIGAALVGTFTGVLVSYAFFAPFSRNLQLSFDSDHYYLMSIKAGLLAHMQGYAPQVSIEFARKILPDELRPTFQELEETVTNLPPD